jgi:hypothetical protein
MGWTKQSKFYINIEIIILHFAPEEINLHVFGSKK